MIGPLRERAKIIFLQKIFPDSPHKSIIASLPVAREQNTIRLPGKIFVNNLFMVETIRLDLEYNYRLLFLPLKRIKSIN